MGTIPSSGHPRRDKLVSICLPNASSELTCSYNARMVGAGDEENVELMYCNNSLLSSRSMYTNTHSASMNVGTSYCMLARLKASST